MGPKVAGVPTLAISGFPHWELESQDKKPFGCGPHGQP